MAVGLAGKYVGPVGAVVAAISGELPARILLIACAPARVTSF
jgi:hypothetical protein